MISESELLSWNQLNCQAQKFEQLKLKFEQYLRLYILKVREFSLLMLECI